MLNTDNAVVGVLSGSEADSIYYGIVKSSTKSASSDSASVQTDVSVYCTDGVTISFTVAKSTTYVTGSLPEGIPAGKLDGMPAEKPEGAPDGMPEEAQLLGYGTKIISSPTIALNGEKQAEYKKFLGIPDDMTAVCMLLVGKTDSEAYDAVSEPLREAARRKQSLIYSNISETVSGIRFYPAHGFLSAGQMLLMPIVFHAPPSDGVNPAKDRG